MKTPSKTTVRVSTIEKSTAGLLGCYRPGTPTTKINLAGCNLACSFCKQEHHTEGQVMSIDSVLDLVTEKQVVVTGGEPLLQQNKLGELFHKLKRKGHSVQVETNGTIVINNMNCMDVDCWVVGYKLGGSNERASNNPLPVYIMLPTYSWLNFVCSNRQDYEEARGVALFLIENEKVYTQHVFVVSVANGLALEMAAEWVGDDNHVWSGVYEHT